jgi:hypothetical protein
VLDVTVETMTGVFADRVAESVERRRSQLVLGLDPVLDLMPVELQGEAGEGPAARGDAVARFCRGLIDAAAPMCVAVKPQLAFFEAFGSHGLRAFEDACAYAREAGLLVIADAKRGDIGSRPVRTRSLPHHADGGPPASDAITLNAYRARVGRAVPQRVQASRRRDHRQEVNAGSADAGSEASGRGPSGITPRCLRARWANSFWRACGPSVGPCRRDVSACRRRGAVTLPAAGAAAPGHRWNRSRGSHARSRVALRARSFRVAGDRLRLPRTWWGLENAADAEAARLRDGSGPSPAGKSETTALLVLAAFAVASPALAVGLPP